MLLIQAFSIPIGSQQTSSSRSTRGSTRRSSISNGGGRPMQGGCTQALKAALELARTGLAVFPCAHNKHPRTPHGLLDASTDPGALRKLWAQHPGPLVGVRTGTGSVDVLDLDTRAPAREWGNVSRTFIRS